MRFTDSTQTILLRGVQYNNHYRTSLSGGGGGESEVVKYSKVDLSGCKGIAARGQVLMFLRFEEIIF
jgi:hypothetical protein